MVKVTCFIRLSHAIITFFPDDLRRKVWPLIVLGSLDQTVKLTNESDGDIESHQYYNQVVLDVRRILKRFPPGW
jgi:hypothetical protein